MIGCFTPDLYASDFPITYRIVGEAKTLADLQSDRSKKQIAAFLDHLALYPKSALYIAVPLVAAAAARHLLRTLRQQDHQHIHTEVIPHW